MSSSADDSNAGVIFCSTTDFVERILDEFACGNHTLAETIDLLRSDRAISHDAFNRSRSQAADRPVYEADLKANDVAMTKVRKKVRQILNGLLSDGSWAALARRSPEAPEEAVPGRYWPFLQLDMDAGTAHWKGNLFAGLRFVELAKVPVGSNIHALVREANQELPPVSPAHNVAKSISGEQQEILHTGGPGRPSSMPLIIYELERRIPDKLEEDLESQATALRDWLAQTHPRAPKPTPRVIENGIRAIYRQATAARKKNPK